MPVDIVVPRLGWSMDEGTFVEWLKKEGEIVREGDMLFVLEGEKAAEEIESFDAGKLYLPAEAPQPGDTVAVGQLLGYLLAEGESPPVAAPPTVVSKVPPQESSTKDTQRVAGPAAGRLARERGIDLDAVPTLDPTGRVRSVDVPRNERPANDTAVSSSRRRVIASPRARRTAREMGVDWKNVVGTGRNGRVRERDVVSAKRHLSAAAAPVPLPNVPGSLTTVSRIRRTIAERMVAGVHQAAPVTLNTKVNAVELASLRARYKSNGAEIVPSYNDILVKFVAESLAECPALNACWVNDAIYVYEEINIALAVDTERGLLAPVLRNVASLSLEEIAVQSRQLAEQARSGGLSQERLRGGTFTVTNLGIFDIDHFTPIINLPQAAILGIGRVVDEPIVDQGRVVPGKTLSLSLTFDHRVIDGAPAARWLQGFAKLIREPNCGP